jgi:hypothetical protein
LVVKENQISDVFEIRASNVVGKEVYRTLEDNIRRRHPQTQVPYLPSYDDLLHLKEPEVLDAIGYHLWQATKLNMGVGQALVPSPIPILGRFLDRLRLEFHNLVVYYLNMSTSQQATAYANLALAMQLLAQDLADLRAHIGRQEGKDDQGS